MHRWDEVTEGYVACCQARGMSAERVKATRREMERWGNWLKARRPRPSVEEIDAELIVRYVRERTVCRAKATVADVVSKLRGVGEYLVREKYWAQNPLRWLRGPKIDPYAQVPLRLGREAMKQLWQKAAAVPAELGRLKALAALALLYGTGLRRGELVRLNVSDWDATAGTLRVDGRKTGRQRCVLLPELAARCLEANLPARQQHLAE